MRLSLIILSLLILVVVGGGIYLAFYDLQPNVEEVQESIPTPAPAIQN